MDLLRDRVAVVTGAASGIGLALCRQLVDLEMCVVAADIEAAPLAAAVAELGSRAVAVPTDVSRGESVAELADAAYARFGAVHLLCNNAGVTVRTSLLEATRDDWDWVLGVNLWGVIHGIEAFIPRMVDAGEPGHIVNTCSMASFLSASRYGIYCATKHAVAAISESLAGDLAEAEAPIGVTAVCPGAVATAFSRAELTRPARYGAPRLTPAGAAERARIEHAQAAAQSAESVARTTLEGVRTGDLFVFPDLEAKAQAWHRMQDILG